MPELPEIETIKRGLESQIVGRSIVEVELLDVAPAKKPKGQFYGSSNDLKEFVIGARIEGLRRRAKVLLIDLSSEYTLMFHLKMTGQVVLVDPRGDRFGGGHPSKSLNSKLPDTSTRTTIILDSGAQLHFNDQRKFGWIKLLPTLLVEKEPFFQKVGPEPFSPQWNSEYLASKLTKRTRAIKTVLLDQQLVGGVGNIYADEALNLAGIHPSRTANTLNTKDIEKLVQSVASVMKDSIERGGTSFSNYVNHLGSTGDYLQHARVFKREGRPCLRCRAEVEKIKLNGRGTHFCPQCQK